MTKKPMEPVDPPVREFSERTHGALVGPAVGLDPKSLTDCLPEALRGHPGLPAFIQAVLDLAANVGSLADDWPAVPGGPMRDSLLEVEDAAHRMQNALQPLAYCTEVFEKLNGDFGYLHLRAHEIGTATQGRPVVPALPADVPRLPYLLTRIHEDLQSLRVACSYSANMTRPDKNAPKDLERILVEGVARLFLKHFGNRPPKRGKFADALIPHIAESMGLEIGHHVIGEVVSKMT